MARQRPYSSTKRDIIVIVIIAVAILGLAIQFHFYEKLENFLSNYRRYYVDEIIFTILILSTQLAIFAFRRWKELRKEISDHSLSKQARAQSELLREALLTTIPNLTFRIRNDGTYLDFRAGNPEDLYGSTDNIIGKKVYDRLPHSVAELYMAHIERTLSSNSVQSFEYELPIKEKIKRYQARLLASGADEVFVLIRNITESDVMSEALAESEKKFRSVVESLSEGLVLTDLDDRVLYMNQRMTDLSGWTGDEVINKPVYSFLLPKSQWPEHLQRNKDRQKGISEKYEMEMVKKNGTTFWAEVYGSPFMDMNKNIVGTIGTITDISEQKWNERLQSALYRITTISRSANDMHQLFMLIHDVVGELMYAKNFYIALYDPVNSMISFPYFVDEVDPPPQPRRFSHGSTEYVLETGNILHAPQTIFDQMSERGDLNLIGAPAVDWLGVPLRSGDKTFGVLTIQSYDLKILFGKREKEILVFVSQHIATIIQQKLEEERFRAIWEHSTDGMRVSDKDGIIVMVNDAYCKMVKKQKEELIGKSINVVYDAEIMESQNGDELYKQRFTDQTIIPRSEAQVFLWNKETIFVEIDSLYLTFGINERMLLSIFRNITERKKLEDQLMHAQKMDSIGVLAGGIAHDFNNVLAMILGSAELVKLKAKDNPEVIRFAQMIATAAERGSSIAKQLLMFARTEKGIHRPISISNVVNDVCELLEHSIPKSITIATNLYTTNDVIMGDEDQLHQVIINLAVNARDAIEQRGISNGTLTFSIKNEHPENLRKQFPHISDTLHVVLEVSDNGNGMSEQTMQRVFEPFFSTKMRGKGTGLGLSIVHGIMKNHNGVIDIKSLIGTGTTFTLYFPAVKDRDDQEYSPFNGSNVNISSN